MSNEVEHAGHVLSYLNEHYPIFIAMLTAVSGMMLWVKKKVINDVFATKEEMAACRSSLADRLDAHEAHGHKQYARLTAQMQDNHDELKDLVISVLREKQHGS